MSRIATLIPAYKADFLGELFAGLQSQSFKDFRVVLSDDSPEASVTAHIRQGRWDAQLEGLELLVVRGPCNPLRNHQHLLDIWAQSTPLVHLLMDDDVIYPDFYREHVALHARGPLSASVSRRWLIRPSGEPFATLPVPAFVNESQVRVIEVGTAQLFGSTVAVCENWLGELSNMVFTAGAALRFPRPPAKGVSYFGLPDVGLLLNAAGESPILFLREHLSGFRQHTGQTTANTQSVNIQIAFVAWIAFALQARRDRQLDDTQTTRAITIAAQRCLQQYATVATMEPLFAAVRDHLADLPRFETAFGLFWHELLSSCPDTRPEAAPAASALRPAVLAVVDDFFPNLLTGFRVAEYNGYLETFASLRVLSGSPEFAAHHAAYAELYPLLAPRVRALDAQSLAGCELAYLNFLNNAHRYLPLLEAQGIAFALTLYPGGGFGIGAPDSDAKLRRVLASPLLALLITTQPITTDYVREFAAEHRINLPPLQQISGGVLNPMYFDAEVAGHVPWFGAGKAELDVCFVAEKYMPRGVNKGYPEFIAAAHALADLAPIRFHVIGGFGANDIDVQTLGSRIRFHGRLETSQLRKAFAGMDLCVALSRPGSLHTGNFDGFPTGSGVEASLCGVALIASDVLGQNPGYVDGESIVMVAPHAAEVERRVREMAAAPHRIEIVGRAGEAVSKRLYAPQRQIGPRIAALRQTAARLGLELV